MLQSVQLGRGLLNIGSAFLVLGGHDDITRSDVNDCYWDSHHPYAAAGARFTGTTRCSRDPTCVARILSGSVRAR